MILSVIVPTYNVAPFIERCLSSIVHQDIDKNIYEIIVVNDESTDSSAQIARRLSNEYSQIRVIDQKNTGLSGARNTGIRHAIGKYLLFVDSDDYLEKNIFREMINFAESRDLEIAMFGQKIVFLDKTFQYFKLEDTTNVMTGMELYDLRPGDSACKYLINTQFLKNNEVYFYEKATFLEDAEWSSRIFCICKRTAYCDIIFYVYELREGSLVTTNFSTTNRAINGYLDSAQHLMNFKRKDILTRDQSNFINQAIIKFVTLPITMLASTKSFRNFSRVRRITKKSGFDHLDVVATTGMRRRHGLLFNIDPLILFIYLITKNIQISLAIKLRKMF